MGGAKSGPVRVGASVLSVAAARDDAAAGLGPVSTPELQLRTLYRLDGDGRIVGKPHPEPAPGPLFCITRGKQGCAWAVRADVPRCLADELDRLAREEPPASDFREPPLHAERYLSLVEGTVDSGPAFTFPERIPRPHGTVFIDDVRALERHFSGWSAGEVPYRTPIVAIVEDGFAVSACFCARRTDEAAEAGLETAPAFRGLGLAPRVAAGWALAIRASGRVPLYSTSWSNDASLAVARKLGLDMYASNWSISRP